MATDEPGRGSMDDWHDAERRAERAHDLYEAGRWEEAAAELRRALAIRPDEPEWYFNLGLTLEAAERSLEAAEAFARSFQLGGGDGAAAECAGRCYLDGGDAHEALVWFQRAETAQPRAIGSYVGRVSAHAKLGQHDQAELAFYMGLEIDPRCADLYVAMSDSLLERELHEKAIWCLKEAVDIAPTLEGAHRRLAEAYAATDRHERARQLYLRELRHNPGDVETLLDLGVLLVRMQRLDEAAEKFRRVLEIEPENPDAHFELGALAQQRGDLAEAMRAFDVVHRLNPDFPGVRRRLACLLLKKRSADDDAHELLQRELRQLKADPAGDDDEDATELGNLLIDAGRCGDAAAVFELLCERRPSDARMRHLLSLARLLEGDLERGKEAAKAALAIDPMLVPAMHNLAIASLREGSWRRAQHWLRRARAVAPDDGSLRRLSYAITWHVARLGVRRAMERVGPAMRRLGQRGK